MSSSGGHYQVAVLGGGLAGSGASIALRSAGFSVATLESTWYQGQRYGETLPGAVVRPLSRLGVWESFCSLGHEPAPTITSLWGSDSS
jgi:2-polyprenyl-6-methoxyphenol hydroxylase-like FAD-dependent oxidoreductase